LVANSLSVSVPQRLQVEKAIEIIKFMEAHNKSDQSAEKAIIEIEKIRSKIHVAELFPSIQHIVKGGRASEAIKKLFGGRPAKTLEKFKFNPLLGLSMEGKLEPLVYNPLRLKGRERVKKLAIDSIVKRIGSDAVRLFIVKFGVEEAEIEDFRSQIIHRVKGQDINLIGEVAIIEQSKTLDIHTGYGALGAVALEQN